MKNIWKHLREDTSARKDFAEELRAKIYEKATEKERTFFQVMVSKIYIPKPRLELNITRKHRFIESLKANIARGIKNIHLGIQRWGMVFGGGILAAVFIVPVYSYFTSIQTVAAQQTYMRDIENVVAISRFQTLISPENNQEIQAGDIISTGENASGEIIFFEGSVLRLSPDTQIQIKTLSPHPYLFSQGGIEIELIAGKIWMKTFQSPTQNSLVLINSENISVTPFQASVSIENIQGKESVKVFENIAHTELRGINVEDNIEVRAGEMISFTPFDEFRPLNEHILDSTPWSVRNIEKDSQYTKEYLANISKKLQEQYILDAVSERMNTFLEDNPDPESMQQVIADINALLLPPSVAPEPEESVILENESNENQDQSIPTTTTKVVYYTPPKPQKTYTSYSKTATPYPTQIAQNSTDTQSEDTSDETAQSSEKSLSATQKIPEDAFEIYAQKRELERQERMEKAANNFSEQVNAFSFPESRETQAENILKKIPDSKESIKLLEKIEENAPRDVKRIVKQKRLELEKQENLTGANTSLKEKSEDAELIDSNNLSNENEE